MATDATAPIRRPAVGSIDTDFYADRACHLGNALLADGRSRNDLLYASTIDVPRRAIPFDGNMLVSALAQAPRSAHVGTTTSGTIASQTANLANAAIGMRL